MLHVPVGVKVNDGTVQRQERGIGFANVSTVVFISHSVVLLCVFVVLCVSDMHLLCVQILK